MPRTNLWGIPSEANDLPRTRDAQCSIETPQFPFICEMITLHAHDELPYVFDLEQQELLELTLRSDIPVDVLLCDMADCERWIDSGYAHEIALLVHLEAEDVLRFTAPQAGECTVLQMNWNGGAADLAVEIPKPSGPGASFAFRYRHPLGKYPMCLALSAR